MRKALKISMLSFIITGSLGVYALTAQAESTAFTGGLNVIEYELYDTLEVPSGQFGNVKAKTVVIRPDGVAITANKIELVLGGEYEIEYSAKVGGKNVYHTETFEVTTNLYSLTKKDSYAVYGKDENGFMGAHNTGKDGLYVKLAKGDVFHYNDVIDLNTSTLDSPAVTFSLYPNVEGIADANAMYMTFTDIYDSENVVTMWYKLSDPSMTRIFSKAPNQSWAGKENSSVHIDNMYGTPSVLLPTTPQSSLGVYFPSEENALYITGQINSANKLQNDFDDTTYQLTPWNGFKTGEVYVSVWFDGYVGDTANILFTDINGQDLSRADMQDKEGPSIMVDTPIIHTGIEGYYYPVFDGIAVDKHSHGYVGLDIRAFYNYSRATGEYDSYCDDYAYELDIVDGKFATPYSGYYSICYRAEDFSGNKTEKVVNVKVEKQNKLVPITGSTFGETIVTAEAGNYVKLPEVYGYTGGTGSLSYHFEVKHDNQDVEVFGNSISGYGFIPMGSGNYSITAVVQDVLGINERVSYELVVVEQVSEAMQKAVVMPKYFIEGFSYTLPSLETISATGNKGFAKIEVTDGNGTRQVEETVAFKADQNGNAVVKYYTSETVKQTYTVPVINVYTQQGDLSFDKYFVSDGIVKLENTEKGVSLATNQDGSVNFIRDMIADNFEFRLRLSSDKNNFGKISYIFTDSENPEIAVKLSIVKKGTAKPVILCNDINNGKKGETFSFLPDSLLSIRYNRNTKSFVFGGANVAVENTVYGDSFEGFLSGKFYLTLAMEDVTSDSLVYITQINTQKMNGDILSDTVAPKVSINGEYGVLDYKIGTLFTTYTAIADDVIDPITKLTLSVTLNDIPVKSVDGITLSGVSCERIYSVRLDEMGTYIFRYTAKDGNGKTTTQAFRVLVGDNEKPVLKIDGAVPTEKGTGKITLPKANATDNVSDCVIWVSVKNPYGEITTLYNGQYSFYADIVGTYIISYYAMDESGNTISQSYAVKIS